MTGRLDIGEVKAPPVIRAARRAAEDEAAELTILDAPPGAACSAVATLQGADLLLLVTEPTAFGLHDLELMVELGRGLSACRPRSCSIGTGRDRWTSPATATRKVSHSSHASPSTAS